MRKKLDTHQSKTPWNEAARVKTIRAAGGWFTIVGSHEVNRSAISDEGMPITARAMPGSKCSFGELKLAKYDPQAHKAIPADTIE